MSVFEVLVSECVLDLLACDVFAAIVYPKGSMGVTCTQGYFPHCLYIIHSETHRM